MIWIQSCEDDLSTFAIIDWLDYYKKEWFRTNDTFTHFEDLKMDAEQADFAIIAKDAAESRKVIRYSDIKAYWYRRGYHIFDLLARVEEDTDVRITNYFQSESETLKTFLYHLLKDKRHINSFSDNTINKLIVSYEAQKIGLRIPSTNIITRKQQLGEILEKDQVISKSLSVSGFRTKEQNYFWATSVLDQSKIDAADPIADIFFPSLVQRHIEKLFEVRSFFLDGQFYSSAILSQNDPQTKTDFRNYNNQKPNRTPPFKLPAGIEEKLRTLFDALKMTSGSVDLIYGTDRQFYFLEVNPVGQFHQVSFPCNYYLERTIAKYLSDE